MKRDPKEAKARTLFLIEKVIKKPGLIRLLDIYELTKDEITYDQTKKAYREIMETMQKYGRARYKGYGKYEIVSTEGYPDKFAHRIAHNISFQEQTKIITRQPAKYDNLTPEERVEKYLHANV